jgi:hypothetical protein
MTYQHVQESASLQGDFGQPLIGVIAEEQGHEVVRYFTEEQEADKVWYRTQHRMRLHLLVCGVTWSGTSLRRH